MRAEKIKVIETVLVQEFSTSDLTESEYGEVD